MLGEVRPDSFENCISISANSMSDRGVTNDVLHLRYAHNFYCLI